MSERTNRNKENYYLNAINPPNKLNNFYIIYFVELTVVFKLNVFKIFEISPEIKTIFAIQSTLNYYYKLNDFYNKSFLLDLSFVSSNVFESRKL